MVVVNSSGDEPPNRLERRKQRTRESLIHAAQAFIAVGKLNAPILDITQAADVGMGSFYNHFESKDEFSPPRSPTYWIPTALCSTA